MCVAETADGEDIEENILYLDLKNWEKLKC